MHKCCNCKRKQFEAIDSRYFLEFEEVSSGDIRCRTSVLQAVKSTRSQNTERTLVLCWECRCFLIDKNDNFEVTWPSFLRNILTGMNTKGKFRADTHYAHLYEPELLWRIIPESMRPWWLEEICEFNINGWYPYRNCTISKPSALFRDLTTSLSDFEEDIDSGEASRLVRALKNTDVMLPNVLCPFGCTEFCRMGQYVEWPFIIQRLLLSSVLPLRKFSTKYVHVQSSWNQYFREENDFDLILLNDDWKVMPTIIWSDSGPKVLTCRYHGGGSDKLYLYPPRHPNHNLSAECPDELCHLKINQRYQKPMMAKAFSTQFAMCRQIGTFSGIATCNLTTKSEWDMPSILRSQHEALSIAGRDDINCLLSKKVEAHQATALLAESLRELSEYKYPPGSLTRYIDGSTFIGFEDNILTQLSVSEGDTFINCIDVRGERVRCRRSWPRRINLIQTEDSNHYGTQFRAIPSLSNHKRVPSMMSWALVAMVSTVKELWHAIDQKVGDFNNDSWEGHCLTYSHQRCFQFEAIRTDKRSPFKKFKNNFSFSGLINSSCRVFSNADEREDPSHFFAFGEEFMRRLFRPADHPTVSVAPSVEDILSHRESFYDDKRVIICVCNQAPETFGNGVDAEDGTLSIGSHSFELRTMLRIRSKNKPSSPAKFDAVSYMRHGRDKSSWWHQELSDKIVTKLQFNPISAFAGYEEDERHFYSCWVCVYVKLESVDTDIWRSRFFKCMGGKPHVICQCNQMPLKPTNRPR